MDMTLTLLMAYVLGGAIWPQIVRSRRFYLLGLLAVVIAMVLWAIPIGPIPFLARLDETAGFVMLVLAAGGGSFRDWWRDLRGAFAA